MKKLAKHGSWLFVGFVTGLTFVGYFYSIRELVVDFATFSANQWALMWTVFFTLATYINAGWMREQVCKYMCPYARFQSVMFDKDTLIVSYDNNRGESRGSRKHGSDYATQGLGDCIDCELCVQVCPTGIDIRDGLQYECIGCALCLDACNSIMDKMQYPRGLISYTSEHQLDGGHTHWVRPRIVGYLVVLLVMVALFTNHILTRIPLELTVIRDRNELFITTDSGQIENIYTLHLLNMDTSMHEFEISISGIEGTEIIGETLYTLDGGENASLTLRVRADPALLDRPSQQLNFEVVATDMNTLHAVSESRFMKPM